MTQKTIWASVAILVLVTGAGLYVIFDVFGNSKPDETSLNAKSEPHTCQFNAELAKGIDAAAVGDVAAFRPLDNPTNLAEISFADIDGNPMSLGAWKGKIVLFNLWATWCPPCREEMPWFDQLQNARGDDRFEVVTVSIDHGDREKPLRFFEETDLQSLQFLHDGTTEAFQTLRARAIALGMPVTVLIDPHGCAIGAMNGPAHWNGADARSLIDKAVELLDNS